MGMPLWALLSVPVESSTIPARTEAVQVASGLSGTGAASCTSMVSTSPAGWVAVVPTVEDDGMATTTQLTVTLGPAPGSRVMASEKLSTRTLRAGLRLALVTVGGPVAAVLRLVVGPGTFVFGSDSSPLTVWVT